MAGKGEIRKEKAERRVAKLDELKQTGVYLGYTEYIQKNEDEDERLKAAEQRLIATGSLVNCCVATG